YNLEILGPDQLDLLESDIEVAIGRVVADHLLSSGYGVVWGLKPSQQAAPDLTVQVSPGVAYDGSSPPKRIRGPAKVASVDLAHDQLGVSTIPPAGQFRRISVCVRQALDGSAPVTYPDPNDPTGQAILTANTRLVEGYSFETWAGVPASSPDAA